MLNYAEIGSGTRTPPLFHWIHNIVSDSYSVELLPTMSFFALLIFPNIKGSPRNATADATLRQGHRLPPHEVDKLFQPIESRRQVLS